MEVHPALLGDGILDIGFEGDEPPARFAVGEGPFDDDISIGHEPVELFEVGV